MAAAVCPGAMNMAKPLPTTESLGHVHVKSLEADECRQLRDVEISFMTDGRPRPVTVIGGANGSGKTTVLELIVSLLGEWGRHNLGSQSQQCYVNRQALEHATNIRLNCAFDDVDCALEFPGFGPDSLWKEANYPAPENEKLVWMRIRAENKIRPSWGGLSGNDNYPNVPSVIYFPDHRCLTPSKGDRLAREDVLYHWTYRCETASAFEGSLNSYLVWLDYAYPNEFAAEKNYLNETILVDKAIHGVDRPGLTATIQLCNGQLHPIYDLSSGEQNLLVVMLELRRRLHAGSIVLIDEIENSLHPAFQCRLAEALLKLQRKLSFQLIVTTHGPSVVDAFGTESTVLLGEF